MENVGVYNTYTPLPGGAFPTSDVSNVGNYGGSGYYPLQPRLGRVAYPFHPAALITQTEGAPPFWDLCGGWEPTMQAGRRRGGPGGWPRTFPLQL
jgi:hypothetical protein